MTTNQMDVLAAVITLYNLQSGAIRGRNGIEAYEMIRNWLSARNEERENENAMQENKESIQKEE